MFHPRREYTEGDGYGSLIKWKGVEVSEGAAAAIIEMETGRLYSRYSLTDKPGYWLLGM